MPTIYRVMKKVADDGPPIGRSATSLGVRIPADIQPDATGFVSPNTGGMSVAPRLADLPPQLLPKRLRKLVPEANGRNNLHVWRMGSGPFADTRVAAGLRLAPDSSDHGTVQPETRMSVQAFEDALAATRDQWIIDESGS